MLSFLAGCLILPLQVFFPLNPEVDNRPPDYVAGKYYEVSSEGESGILLLQQQDSFAEEVSYYFADEGQLYANPVRVGIVKGIFGGEGLQMTFPDGRIRFVSWKPYDAPEYKEFPAVSVYSTPVYEVEETCDVSYGHANGFWTSYPAMSAKQSNATRNGCWA